MPGNTLADIETKVRRLTRSPSVQQLSQADLDNYINTFIVYDLPEHIRTFNLRTQFTFYTNPFQDVYITDATLPQDNVLYNFQNLYISVHDPVYIAGYDSFYTQSRQQFFGIYPMVNSIIQLSGVTGNGITTTFTGQITLNQAILVPGQTQQTVLLQNNVLFTSVDTNGNALAMIDVPVIVAATGNNSVNGNLYSAEAPGSAGGPPLTSPTVVLANNTVNYSTGSFTVTFLDPFGNPVAPGNNQPIYAQVVPTVVSQPQALMYYNNKFTVRPVPDKPYRINFEVYARPTALLTAGSIPQLEEWWQYIAYGAAKKIFEDRMDLDSVQMIMPEFKKQQAMMLRRSIVQYTNERTATIYTEQTSFGPGSGAWGWGGSNF